MSFALTRLHPYIRQMLLACLAGSAARDRGQAQGGADIVILPPADVEAWGLVRVLHSGAN